MNLLDSLFNNISIIFQRPTFILLIYLIIIWGVGVLFKRIGFPVMLGEMLAGIVLGPPVLNIIQPNSHIEWLAELGIFFLMFFTGMEMDIKKMKKTSKSAIGVAFGGTLIPFLAGFFITIAFKGTVYQALFIGMAISVTSIATKGRVLHELGLLKTKLGHMMLNAALYDNVFSLVLFAIVISLAKVGTINFFEIGKLSIEIFVFFIFVISIGYFIFPRLEKQFSSKGSGGFTFCLIIALLFGLFAEIVGLHFVVGVFIAGIFVRKDVMRTTKLYNNLFDTMYSISYGFLGPLFFITLSFHINFQIFFTDMLYFLIALSIGAIVGKVLGASLSAKLTGINMKDSIIVGFAMNGRGMIEIILVVIGIEMGVLNDDMVSILVFIAMLTTLLTPLVLRLIVGKNRAG